MNELGCVEMAVRGSFDLRMVAAEAYDVGENGSCPAMVRVVNAASALELLQAPAVPGRVSIRVTDEQIPENNEVFTVTGDGDNIKVTLAETDAADVCCDIRGLSALVMGRHSLQEAADYGVAEVRGTCDLRFTEQLFTKRMLHLNHSF